MERACEGLRAGSCDRVGRAHRHRANRVETGGGYCVASRKLKPKKLFLFHYRMDSSTLVPLAVQKGMDRTIHASFAACRPCFRSGSYEFSDKVMCGHCRHIMTMTEAKAETSPAKSSCALPRIEYAMEGDKLLVHAATIESEFSWHR